MVNTYINVEKEHENVISCLYSLELNAIDLSKIATQNEVSLVCTSFSRYGETKKNLSDIELFPDYRKKYMSQQRSQNVQIRCVSEISGWKFPLERGFRVLGF